MTEVFSEERLAKLAGDRAIGHVRYSTTGGGGIENVQPFLFRHNSGDFALAHNGNLVNSEQLVRYLEDRGSLFQSSSDSEILAHLIKKETNRANRPRIHAIVDALNMMEGAFAFLVMTANRIYACRDKYGLRPLSIGRLGDGYVVSSETCAFDVIGAEFVRDVEPGEIVTIDRHGLRSMDYSQYKRRLMCAMEYIYFSRPDSDIEGCNVHAFRKETGRRLFHEAPAEADIVIGVPDSSLSAASGYSEASGIPYEMGLIKNKYIGRTFIQPSQELREKGVRMKLSAVKSVVRGKRVALIDDSVVRGTTSRRIVAMLRDAGALEVHVRIASPRSSPPASTASTSRPTTNWPAPTTRWRRCAACSAPTRWPSSRPRRCSRPAGAANSVWPASRATTPRRSTGVSRRPTRMVNFNEEKNSYGKDL